MSVLLGSPKAQFFKSGTVEYASGYKIYSYTAGTMTPKATYPTIADALAGTNANTNPIILDSRGEANIVLQGSTKLALVSDTGSEDSPIWTVDNLAQSSADILDANGNELLKFNTTADAVNEWTITNAAASGTVVLEATGGDADVAAIVRSKGADPLYLDGGSTGTVEIANNSAGNINLRKLANAVAGLTTTTLTATGAISTSSTVSATGAITTSNNLSMSDVTKTFTLLPAGVVSWYAGGTAPSGWLECDGSAISRTTYSALFAVIGTTYGAGDGSTTFNLPAQARRTLVGKGGSGTATLGNAVGNTGGAETVTLTNANMPANVPYCTGGVGSVAVQGGATTNVPANNSVGWTAGGATAVNNIQPSLVMMLIMRAY